MLRYAASTPKRGTPVCGALVIYILLLATSTTLIPGCLFAGATQPYPGRPHNATASRYNPTRITPTARDYYGYSPVVTVADDPNKGELSTSNSSQEDKGGIHVASWNWQYVRTPFIYTAFVVIAGLCKVGKAHIISRAEKG